MNETDRICKTRELPEPYKTLMENNLEIIEQAATIALDIGREFGGSKLELENGEMIVIIEAREG